MKVEEVLVAKGYVSRNAARSAVQASTRERVPVERLLLTSGAITGQKLKEALVLSDEDFEEFTDPLLFLKRISFFSQMNDRALQEIAATASWEWFPRDYGIIAQGAKTADFHIIQSGRARVCVSEGERETTLAVLSRGECFGEMSLLSGGVTTATVKAAEPILCLKQRRRQFLEMMTRYPTLHDFFSSLIVKRVRTTYKKLLVDTYPFPQTAPFSSPSTRKVLEKPVMVLTLGTFGLVRKGKPVVFVGKVQRKPLLLLKALICLGGRQVREGTVTELLWPDSEGDAAHIAFTSTVLRLRRLLGSHRAIEISEAKVRINPDYVWIDMWEFDRLSRQADGPRSDSTAFSTVDAIEKAVRLYKGHFLPSEDHFWVLPVRENLRNRFARLVSGLGDILERQGELGSALQCYQNALEIDDLVEEFYQRLMVCHRKRGCRAEAVAVYERCARMLHTELGIDPSDKTLAIIAKIKSNTA